MKARPGYNPVIVNGALLVLTLPLFYIILRIVNYALPAPVGLFSIAAVGLIMFGLVFVLGRVGPALALLLMFQVIGTPLLNSAASKIAGPVNILEFGKSDPVLGVRVSCNGVELGRTPFRVNDAEFNARVRPWPTPPPQPRMTWPDRPIPNDNDRYSWAKFSLVPWTPFMEFSARSQLTSKWMMGHDEAAREIIRSSRYWMSFDWYGCIGLSASNSLGGGGHGTSRETVTEMNPQVEFPSVEPHLDRLVAALHAGGGRPSPAWLAHWRKYQGLLFLPAWRRAQGDPQLLAALQRSVRDEFAIPERPTPEDAGRVLLAVVERAGRLGRFMTPSPESVAIDLLGQSAVEPLTRLALQELNASPSGGMGYTGRSSSGDWTVSYASEGMAQRLPLEYAIARIRPPGLFDHLVYAASANPAMMSLVARYRRPETERIVQDYLQPLAWPMARSGASPFAFSQAMNLIIAAPNPALEDLYRQVILENTRPPFSGDAGRYIDSRIGNPEIDQSDLASWILHFSPLRDEEKAEKLARIKGADVSVYLEIMAQRGDMMRERIVSELVKNPHPGAAQVLLHSVNQALARRDDRGDLSSLLRTLALINTPEAREGLKEFFTEPTRMTYRSRFIQALSEAASRGADLGWTVDFLRQADTPEARGKAAPLLLKIGSPEAQAIVEQWAAEPATAQALEKAKKAVEDVRARAEAERRKAEAEKQEMLRQAEALISGRMQPDQLLPPQPVWVWNGSDYVAQ